MAKGRIFIVEDETLVRFDLTQQLSMLGYDIVGQASSGKQALGLIEKTRPDLVLMDITIAGEIDGIQTAKLIPDELQVAVIFLTAYAEESTRERARGARPYGYVLKPIVSRELDGTIQIALQRRAMLQSVRAGQDHLQLALDAASMASWEWDAETRTITFGAHSATIFGLPEGQASQTEADFLALVEGEDLPTVRAIFETLETEVQTCAGEFRYLHPSAGERWLKLQGKVFAAGPNAAGFDAGRRIVGVAQDVTERHHTEHQLREIKEKLDHLAHHDPMTGLPNRLLAMDRLDQALERCRRRGESLAICFVDLDHFKQVNDTLGHAAGDELLRVVSRRMQECVRSEDTVARLGGDEFMIIMERVSSGKDAGTVAAKVQAALAQTIQIGETELSASCTIGISLFPQDAADRDGLIKAADTAMYVSKEKGRGSCSFYNSQMALEARLYTLETRDLRRGLEAEEFRLLYQPQISMRDGSVVGLEALIRWQHPRKGLLGAQHVIPLAERSGLIVDVGQWVIRRACLQLREWLDQGMGELRIAVNVSARQMHSGGLLDTVCRALDEAGVAPRCLEIEITESTLQNEEACLATMSALSELGVTLAIDDFGTGYSCLSSLKSFPIHQVKIDRAFVQDIIDDHSDRAITEAILVMAHKLNMRVIAEGVETLAQERLLRAQGCDEAQGYLYAKPLPPDEIPDFVAATARNGQAIRLAIG